MRTERNAGGSLPVRCLLIVVALAALALVSCTDEAMPADSPAISPGQPVERATPPPAATLPPSLPATAPPAPTARPTSVPAPGLTSHPPEDADLPLEGALPFSPDYPFPAAPERDLYRLAAQLSPESAGQGIPRIAYPAPSTYAPGREDPFWLVDFRNMTMYQSDFELRLVTPSAYWYVEKGQPVLQRDLEVAAREFEDRIYPRVSAALGSLWAPGGERDQRLNIVHAALQGVAGYYSSADEYPLGVSRFSNERKTIYINIRSLSVGQQSYLQVLAHELQHAIHWNGNPSEDTWVNEGLSELAVTLAGYHFSDFPPASIRQFLRRPNISLIHWPLDNSNISAHYGAASLFMHYLAQHYSQDNDLRALVRERTDGIAGIDAYLHHQGYDTTFRGVFRDWIIANLLDEDHGPYGYRQFRVDVAIGKSIDRFSQLTSTLPQYSAEYVRLGYLPGPMRIRFEGMSENQLLPVDVGEAGCWWSNSGDSISSTLTRSVDLRGMDEATLSYQVWYNVEKNWDYGYVQVSPDQGQTWHILETPHTTPENPIGNSFGPGYTGDSHGWLNEEIDLSRFTGGQVMVRFHYVTDDAVNGAGLCFRDVAIPEAGVWANDPDWQADGFILTDNVVDQDYLVYLVQMGETNRVVPMALDAQNRGQMLIARPENYDRLVVVVAALAPKTLLRAPYALTIEPAD